MRYKSGQFICSLHSRLEGLTERYGVDIIIGEYTRTLVPDFACRELDKVRVKGKHKPVSIFEPLGPAAGLDPQEAERLQRYHQALAFYRGREFAAAAEIFEGLIREEPHRLLYGLYRDRIRNFQQNPPAQDWDGSFTHTTK